MSATDRTSPVASLLVMVPVVLLAAGVRILGLGNTDLWGDEAFSVMASLGPVRHLLSMLSSGEPHPPLYPFLLVVWLRAFGHSEFVARLPSAFVGIASVAAAASFARFFVPKQSQRGAALAAFVAGLLVALNPIQVWYSQEARMYAQVSFFAGLASLALLRMWCGRRYGAVLYVVAVLGAAGSHYYGLFVPLAHGFAVLVFARRRKEFLLRWIRAAAVAAILYLPWVAVALHVFADYYGAQPGTVNLPAVALSGWVRVAAGWSLSWIHALALAAIVTIIALGGFLVRPRSEEDRFARVVLGFWLVTPFVAGFVISLVRPIYAERYFVVSSLPFVLLMTRAVVGLGGWGQESVRVKTGGSEGSSALAEAPRRSVATLAFGVGDTAWRLVGMATLLVAVGVALPPLYNVWIGRYLKSAYNTHMRMVNALARPNDAVILDGTSQLPLYTYYLKKPFPTFPLPTRVPLDQSATADALARIDRDYDGAWVFLYATPDYDPGYFIPRWLNANAYRAFDIWEVNGRLQYYRFAAPQTMADHPVQIKFGDALLLQKYAWHDAGYPAGASIPVDLEWRWLPTKLSQPRVSLRLVDDSGLTWAQSDQSIGGGYLPDGTWPVGQVLDDHHGLMIPPGTPPGSYRLLLNVYSADHPDHLPAGGEGANVMPAGVDLAAIDVSAPSQGIWPGGIAGFHATTASFGGSLALLGYAGSDRATAGESGYLTLVWKALTSHPDVTRIRLKLIAGDGTIAEQRDLTLATDAYPPSRWNAGDVLREQYRIPIAERLAPGTYSLSVQPLMGSSTSVVLGSLTIDPGRSPTAVTRPEYSLDFLLGGAVELVGFDLDTNSARPGATVRLTLHWKDVGPLDGDYTVFVHVLDASEKVVAQRDQQPADGKRPTSSWFPGDEILDQYGLTLPSSLPPGEYPIEVGMYNPSNGKRLPVSLDGKPDGDRIVVAQLRVGE